MLRKLLMSLILTGVTTITFGQQHEHTASKETLGKVHFPISCTPEAQTQFDRAMAMLHSFWYQEGLNAFTGITKTDPECAMAYWGIAVQARGNPLVSAPDPAAFKTGSEAIQKAKTLSAKTLRERDYIDSMGIYYQDAKKVDHRTRVLAYEKAMEHIYRKYSEDPEAAVFYALALNEAVTVLPPDKTYARPQKAGQILERVLAVQPNHPGALHYLIHSYDFPPLASRGLAAAQRYAGVAPSAPHALHMPSHIFSMLGMWPESIQSNKASLSVSKTYVHAMDFMAYAYLQGAQDVEAKRLVVESAVLQEAQAPATTRSPTGGVLGVYTAYAAIPARFAIERGKWAEACALQVHSTFPAADAITHFARAMGCARVGNVTGARKSIEQLQLLTAALARAKDSFWSEQVEIQQKAAESWLAHAEGKKDLAVKLMRVAADREDASEKHVAMENRLWPMRELLGELYLARNEPAKALLEFETSFKLTPNRFRGFYGAAKAAEQSANREKARSYYEKLLANCGQADSSRPELTEAKVFWQRSK